jgi:hypothetical protein
MALQLTSLNFSGLMWENLSSDLLIIEISKKKMSVTQRQGVITCIPKEGKSNISLKINLFSP